MIYRDVYGWHSLGIGGTGEVLVSDGTRPSWGDLPAHAHGNLSSTGVISTNTAPASGQHLVITSSGNALQQSSITFGTSTTTFLRNDGTWQTGTGAVQSVNGYTGVVSTEVLTTSTSTVNSVTYGRTYGIAVRDSVATRMRISTGVINPTGTSSNSISFGTTFSNVPVVTVFQLKAASTTDTIVSAKATAVTTTGATITMSFANASTDGYTPSGQTYGWIAIGV